MKKNERVPEIREPLYQFLANESKVQNNRMNPKPTIKKIQTYIPSWKLPNFAPFDFALFRIA